MALYEIAVSRSANPTKTISVIRRFSETPITALKSKIEMRETVISVRSNDYPVGGGPVEGPRGQHDLFHHCLRTLAQIGDEVEIRYRPSADYPPEVVDEQMLRNLMESELASRSQQYD